MSGMLDTRSDQTPTVNSENNSYLQLVIAYSYFTNQLIEARFVQ